jgi:hypothetical protein
MRSIQPLVRLPHSHLDPNWLSNVERASRTPPRELYEWAAGHILSAIGIAPRKSASGRSSVDPLIRRSPPNPFLDSVRFNGAVNMRPLFERCESSDVII